jgi:hypothetical protein|tara:strand:- start:7032 stop:7238 length:207 start_codon:yes stop_codon:yes gene_type:complete
MPRYRKKPIVIYAEKITKPLYIRTLEGIMEGRVGDYLVTGVKGEKYPCRADIFEETYELVEDSDEEEK